MSSKKRNRPTEHNCNYSFQHDYNSKEYELSFKLGYLYFIDDSLSTIPPEFYMNNNTLTKLYAPDSLIEKVALTIIATEMTNKTQILYANFTEAMIIREIGQSSIIVDGENMGLNIKKEVMTKVFVDAYRNKLQNENLLKSINYKNPKDATNDQIIK